LSITILEGTKERPCHSATEMLAYWLCVEYFILLGASCFRKKQVDVKIVSGMSIPCFSMRSLIYQLIVNNLTTEYETKFLGVSHIAPEFVLSNANDNAINYIFILLLFHLYDDHNQHLN